MVVPHGCERTFGMDWHRYTCMPTIDVDGLLSDGGEPCFGEMMRPAAWHRLGGKRHHWNEPKLFRQYWRRNAGIPFIHVNRLGDDGNQADFRRQNGLGNEGLPVAHVSAPLVRNAGVVDFG